VDFRQGSTYTVRDLDLKRPAAAKNPPRPQFETTTAEVLRKADFRVSISTWQHKKIDYIFYFTLSCGFCSAPLLCKS